MKNNVGLNKKGFTIIEVVLVLAIAGLIFLIVFLAVPALQRSRRDTQRRSDASRMIAQLEQYAANNNGNYPTDSSYINGANSTFAEDYMDSFEDPSEGAYTINALAAATNGDIDPGVIEYSVTIKCSSTGNNFETGQGGRDIAVRIGLETGGAYCQDNQ